MREGLPCVVQWLRFCASTAEDTGSIPGWGTNIPHDLWCGQEKIFNFLKSEKYQLWAASLKKFFFHDSIFYFKYFISVESRWGFMEIPQ